jgi:succinate dehydrogenase/fumarate reductase flavoprotein subunit
MSPDRSFSTDILVIGGGSAGLVAAIKSAETGRRVILVEKSHVGKAGVSYFAWPDMEVYKEGVHDLKKHMDFVIQAGEYVNNRDWVEIILKETYARYQELLSWGVPPRDISEEDKVRYSHVPKKISDKYAGELDHGAMAHKVWLGGLREKALKIGVAVLDRVMITDLIKKDGVIAGAVGFHTREGDFYTITAKAIIVATGSGNFKAAGEPWHQWTADGEAMSYRAGARITGKEFGHKDVGSLKDFPTVPKGVAKAHSSRIYVNGKGDDYMKEYSLALHSNELCAVFEIHAGRGPIFLDFDRLTPEDRQACVNFVDAWGRGYEVGKAIDYATVTGKREVIWGSGAGCTGWGWGGIKVNTRCESNIPGLYAAGDSAGTCAAGSMEAISGIGGAAVTGNIAALNASQYSGSAGELAIGGAEMSSLKEQVFLPLSRKGGFSPAFVTEILRNLMVPYFIVQVKKADRLQAAITMVNFVQEHLIPRIKAGDAHGLRMAHEIRNMALDAEIVLKSSLFRTESRGSHYREDYPRRNDPDWLAWTIVQKTRDGMDVSKLPIPKNWWPDLSKPYEERYTLRFPGE